MGTKKHKKDSKKKKHRSRSRSPLEGEERERKRHRKHKDRKKNRSPDVEEVPVDSHLHKAEEINVARSYSSSEEHDPQEKEHHSSQKDDSDTYRSQEIPKERSHEADRDRDRERQKSPGPAGSGAAESLSVEDTNRLRAKLGLKPLQEPEKPAEDGKFKDDLGEFYHQPAVNIAHQKKADKLKERLEERREKRKLDHKLQTTLLAASSDEEDAAAWVNKSREMDKQKREAAKRAAELDEMDAAFGVSALLADDAAEQRRQRYAPHHLRGLRVAHHVDALGEEREVVLTLQDKEVLAEDAEDVLVNVNLLDDERYKKNVEEGRRARAGYRAYDDEADLQAAALGLPRPVLAKYDDEIHKGAADASRGFLIGDERALEASKLADNMRRERAAGGGAGRRLESLRLPEPQPARDYWDHHELDAKFKKPRRRGKMRKKAKEEPIDVEDYEAGGAPLDTDDTDVQPHQLAAALPLDDEETEPDTELQAALARARRLRQAGLAQAQEEVAGRVKLEPGPPPPEEADGGAMVFDATAEFCRTLGDIPTYGLAGNRDRLADSMELERDADTEAEAEPSAGAWSRVDVGSEAPPDLTAGSSVALDAEPALGAGVAGALQLALSKGYLERAGGAPPPPGAAPRALDALLAARHYSIEDKTYGEDDKHGRRERGGGGGGGGGGYAGPLQEFREKAHFRPNIKLEYVDDDGRPLRPKEAFRYLSHKFHGKGPGKNKQEKRIKKAVQEGLMKKMSSTDTPLGTLQMLQDKQRETHSPYIVLSGAKRDPNN